MSKKKIIEVSIRVPEDWLDMDELDLMRLIGGRVKERVEDSVMDRAIDKIMGEIKIPKVKISPKEVKDRMLDIMAQRALDGDTD